jgi:hypothetical protein
MAWVPKKILVEKIGRATQSRLPAAIIMRSDEIDISETSNSW